MRASILCVIYFSPTSHSPPPCKQAPIKLEVWTPRYFTLTQLSILTFDKIGINVIHSVTSNCMVNHVSNVQQRDLRRWKRSVFLIQRKSQFNPFDKSLTHWAFTTFLALFSSYLLIHIICSAVHTIKVLKILAFRVLSVFVQPWTQKMAEAGFKCVAWLLNLIVNLQIQSTPDRFKIRYGLSKMQQLLLECISYLEQDMPVETSAVISGFSL
jgi:hypothetical protein